MRNVPFSQFGLPLILCCSGSAWLSVPLGFATTMGLSAIVLTTDPSFPNYPNPLTSAQVGAGLPAAAAASALLGQSGAVAMLVLLFLAVTSAASAELVAVSSLMTCAYLLLSSSLAFTNPLVPR